MRLQEKFLLDLAAKGERADNRGSEEYRDIVIEKNIIEKAEGSARVKVGNTEVIAGVKLGVGEPFPDKPDQGVLITSAEFSPVASPDFEKGPPTGEAIELARVVDRGIRESEAIDMEKLLIEENKVWIVYIDIHILNHSGNLIDTAALAAIAALLDARLPEYDGQKVNYEKKGKSLPVRFRPVAVTMSRIGERTFIDSTLEEEGIAGARLTVTLKDDGNICALQKGGTEPLSVESLERAIETASRKAAELRKLL